jgi:hypothetical protein
MSRWVQPDKLHFFLFLLCSLFLGFDFFFFFLRKNANKIRLNNTMFGVLKNSRRSYHHRWIVRCYWWYYQKIIEVDFDKSKFLQWESNSQSSHLGQELLGNLHSSRWFLHSLQRHLLSFSTQNSILRTSLINFFLHSLFTISVCWEMKKDSSALLVVTPKTSQCFTHVSLPSTFTEFLGFFLSLVIYAISNC